MTSLIPPTPSTTPKNKETWTKELSVFRTIQVKGFQHMKLKCNSVHSYFDALFCFINI